MHVSSKGSGSDIAEPINPDETPYGTEEFAERHGLTIKAAEALLLAKGPSRHKCDAGARGFLAAVAVYRRQSRI